MALGRGRREPRNAKAGGHGLEVHHRNGFLITTGPELPGPAFKIELPPALLPALHYLFPLLLVPSQAPTSLSESPIGRDHETKRQERSKVEKEVGWAETPRSWGTRNKSGMGDIWATWGFSREEEGPALLIPPPAPVPSRDGAFSSLLAPLQPPPWRFYRAQGRALTARAEPWAGAHGCLEAAPVSSWQSQSAGGGEWAVGGGGQPAV